MFAAEGRLHVKAAGDCYIGIDVAERRSRDGGREDLRRGLRWGGIRFATTCRGRHLSNELQHIGEGEHQRGAAE